MACKKLHPVQAALPKQETASPAVPDAAAVKPEMEEPPEAELSEEELREQKRLQHNARVRFDRTLKSSSSYLNTGIRIPWM